MVSMDPDRVFDWQNDTTADEVTVTIQGADPEDPKQRELFLEGDLSQIESEFRAAKQRATFRVLDANGDGDSCLLLLDRSFTDAAFILSLNTLFILLAEIYLWLKSIYSLYSMLPSPSSVKERSEVTGFACNCFVPPYRCVSG